MVKDSGVDVKQLRVDGGACANNFLMQFQADIMDVEVCRPAVIESTALGAIYLAGLAVGYYKDKEEITKKVSISRTFEPQMDDAKRQRLVRGWNKAVKHALDWAKDEE